LESDDRKNTNKLSKEVLVALTMRRGLAAQGSENRISEVRLWQRAGL